MSVSSWQHHLDSQLPRLLQLHAQLALSPAELERDHGRVDEAIRTAVDVVVQLRQKEVEGWKKKLETEQKGIARLCEALCVDRQDRELAMMPVSKDSLPSQFKFLTESKAVLKQSYLSRLKRVEALHMRLDDLCRILGPSFPLQRPSDSTAQAAETPDEVLIAVGEHEVQALERLIADGEAERTRRIETLRTLFISLLWLHFDLSLPSLSSPTHNFPSHLLPTPPPGTDNTAHEGILGKFIEINQPEDMEAEELRLKGGVDFDPVEGMLDWAKEVEILWTREKSVREEKIQAMYDALVPIWNRLDLSEEEREAFINEHRGLSDDVIAAYNFELSRVTRIRNENLMQYIESVRREIEGLWESLYYGDVQKGGFQAFWEEDLSEDILTQHETYLNALQAEWDLKSPVISKVQEWFSLAAEETELENRMHDPNRFKKGGAAMLQEEKMRKRVNLLKPKVERELLIILQDWETDSGEVFLVNGQGALQQIKEALEAKEATKRRSKVATPGRIGAQTPATSRAGSRTPAPQTARKRDAPTPTPSATAGTKRAKTTAGSMTSSTSLSLSTSSNGAPLRSPAPVCGLPRPVVVAGSSAGRSISLQDVLGNSTAQNRAAQARSWSNGLVDKREGASKLGLAAGRRPARRDSFRPRPSVGGLAMTGGTGRERDEILAEEQDVF